MRCSSSIKIRFNGIRFDICNIFRFLIVAIHRIGVYGFDGNRSNDREHTFFGGKMTDIEVGAFCVHTSSFAWRSASSSLAHFEWTLDTLFCAISMFCGLWLTFFLCRSCCRLLVVHLMPTFVYLICAHTIINFVEMSTGATVPASSVPCAIYRV